MSEQSAADGQTQDSGQKSPEGKAGAKDKTKVVSETPENALGQLNPSSPGNTGTTPGSDADLG